MNLLAAAAQMSSYTHVEIAIGEVLKLFIEPQDSPPDPQIRLRLTNVSATSAYCSQVAGQRGMMANVARIFNDACGAVSHFT